MAFKGITFAGQNVTPKNDGGLYQAHCGDGILWGCSMAISGDDLVIQSGEFIAGGRVCWVDGATNVDLSSRTLTNGYIQVVMDFDISKPEGMQWNTHLPLIESATTTFPALTQDDINDTGTLYQVELAVVQISGGNLTAIYSSMGGSGLISNGTILSNGSLRINSDGIRRAVSFHDNNVGVGRLRYNNVTNYTEVGSINPDATLKAGLRSYNDTEIFADNDSIYFHPKGVTVSTNEVYIDTNGQIHGGCLMPSDSTKSSQNITANTWTSVCSQPLSAGTWLLMGTASFKCLGASSNDWAMISIGVSNAATACRNSTALGGNTSVYLGLNGFYIATVNSSQTINLYVEASANTTVQNCVLRAVQIG